ncbi:MAG: hypothetical protein QNJ00_06195 [Woeseiaceae bacterium]|nr:hypothetical protein [Woeseiaceae bacterium]MDJ0939335.1 hypothetical protein [Woeseiaceae bacterium]
MNKHLLEELCELASLDERTRSELVASGELFDGYHPRMAAVHAANAAALERIVNEWGWPGKSLVGEKGADAAWTVLQHSIGYPGLQRSCLPLLEDAATAGEVPAHQPAFLEDRICCFEGRPQRYGTQLDWDENGELSPLPLQEPDRVDSYRASVGLGPLSERVEQARIEARDEGATPPEDFEQWQRDKKAWARSVGWF